MDIKAFDIVGKGTKWVNVDSLKYEEYIGRLIAVELEGRECRFGDCYNYHYETLINLGAGDSPEGETEGGIWALSFDGHAYWLRHNTPVYLLNAKLAD